MTRARLPLDPAAGAAANAAVRDQTDPPGRRLDPSSGADASLRVEWMAAYAAAGGAVEGAGEGKKADDPILCCAPPASGGDTPPPDYVTFCLLDESTSQPIDQVTLDIAYPDGSVHQHVTDARGMVSIPGQTGDNFTVQGVAKPKIDQFVSVSTVQRT